MPPAGRRRWEGKAIKRSARTDRRQLAPIRPGRPKGAPVLLFLFLIVLSAALISLLARRPAGKALVLTGEESLPLSTAPPPTSASLFPVHIDGAVVNPGIYYVQEGAILGEALEEAGGITEEADPCAVNLALRLQPHMKVYLPRAGELPPLLGEGVSQGPDARVDINRATREELESLPGVGEATSAAIIAHREEEGPFGTIEDLMLVPGIKEGRFARLKDRIYVSGP